MFQTIDSSNDEIDGFHGESQPNGKSSKSFESKQFSWSNLCRNLCLIKKSHTVLYSI